jgi:hypothetical protein
LVIAVLPCRKKHLAHEHHLARLAPARITLAPRLPPAEHGTPIPTYPSSPGCIPGGYTPALSKVVTVVEQTRLWITDIEVLSLHYAKTLRSWRQRFEHNRNRLRALR